MTAERARSRTPPAVDRARLESAVGTQPAPSAAPGLSEWAASVQHAFSGLSQPSMEVLTDAWLAFSRLDANPLAFLAGLPPGDPAVSLLALEEVCRRLLALAPPEGLHADALALVQAFQLAVLRRWVQGTHDTMERETRDLRGFQRAMFHDLSNIMSSISGNLDYVEQVASGQGLPKDAALLDATAASRQAQDVVGRAGDLAALESGAHLGVRSVGMDGLLKSLRLPPDFQVQLLAPLPRHVMCAEPALARVLRFLCSRALAAGPLPPLLRVEHAGPEVRMTVVDQGSPLGPGGVALLLAGRGLEPMPGLPNDRVDRTRGYHVSEMVMRAHGGSLVLHSPKTGGMSALVVLPHRSSDLPTKAQVTR